MLDFALKMMDFAFKFDKVWLDLTVKQHLEFYGE